MSVVDPIRVTLHVQETSPITVNSNILPKIIEGISPEVSLEETADGVVMTVTDKSGTETALIPKGPQGDDYVLTEEDKTEIATQAAEMVDVTGKADKVTGAAAGNFAGLDANGNLVDSGKKPGDFLTQHQDISGKADKADTVLTTTLSRGRAAGSTVGERSFAFGDDVSAAGANAYAQGDHTIASRKSQHVFGEYNVEDATGDGVTSRGTYIEIVGKGDANARANARTLKWNGDEWVAGKITVGKAPSSNMDVATKQYVDQSDADKQNKITASGLLKGDGNGGVTAATAGTDYGTYSKPSGGIPAEDLAAGVIPDQEDLIDDTAGTGDTDKVWSADKSSQLLSAITDKQDAPASGSAAGKVLGLTEENSELVPTWVDQPTVPVTDVQVNGTSILQDGVANVPVADAITPGVVKVINTYGLDVGTSGQHANYIRIVPAPNNRIKCSDGYYNPVTTSIQHASTFYGLAKAAGDSTQSASSNTVGAYTESAKSAISEMLNGSVSVSGSTPSITALPGVRYVCGECSTLDITVPASGVIDVVFDSGSTATVLTITPPTGQTVKWANGFDPTSLDANTTYEINIMDGEYGVVGQWT